MHFADNPVDEKKLATLVGADNPLTKQFSDEDARHERYEVFEAVDAMVSAAREMYCDSGKWKKTLGYLCEAIDNLSKKEPQLKKLAPKD